MNKFKFEKLIIWQKTMDLGEEIAALSEPFPDKEKFHLSSQIRRATASIALNISEGSIGQSNPEQKKFMEYAIRSLAEVVTFLYQAKRKNYLNTVQFGELYNKSFELMNLMIAFRYKINQIKMT